MGLARDQVFALKLRMPAWCPSPSVHLQGQSVAVAPGADGYVAIHRAWKDGDAVDLDFKLEPRVVVGDHKNHGKLAVLYGPLVLAAEADLIGEQLPNLNALALPSADLTALAVTPEAAPEGMKTWPGAQVFRVNAMARRAPKSGEAPAILSIRLIPFADAGNSGAGYRVWIPVGQGGSNLLMDERKAVPAPATWRVPLQMEILKAS